MAKPTKKPTPAKPLRKPTPPPGVDANLLTDLMKWAKAAGAESAEGFYINGESISVAQRQVTPGSTCPRIVALLSVMFAADPVVAVSACAGAATASVASVAVRAVAVRLILSGHTSAAGAREAIGYPSSDGPQASRVSSSSGSVTGRLQANRSQT